MTQKVVLSTSGTASLTDAPASELIVIDWIVASGTTTGSSDLVVAVAGNNVARKNVNISSDFIFLDFHLGYPVWSASDGDSVAATSVTVTLTGPNSNSQLVVGYHYAPMSAVRD